jgi:hypothetical protein
MEKEKLSQKPQKSITWLIEALLFFVCSFLIYKFSLGNDPFIVSILAVGTFLGGTFCFLRIFFKPKDFGKFISKLEDF